MKILHITKVGGKFLRMPSVSKVYDPLSLKCIYKSPLYSAQKETNYLLS